MGAGAWGRLRRARSMYSHRGWSYASSSTPATMSAYRRRRLRLPHPPAVGPLPFAVLLVAGVAWYHFAFSGFEVRGSIVDSSTAQPLGSVSVWSSRANTASSTDSPFAIGRVKPPELRTLD